MEVDREQFAQKLNDIHTLASRTDTLTIFNDFGSPPGALPATESKGITGDPVRHGFSGLYSRFREAVAHKMKMMAIFKPPHPDMAPTQPTPLPRRHSR